MPDSDWNDATSIKANMAAFSKQGLAQAGPPEATLIEDYIDITMRDGAVCPAKVYRPFEQLGEGSPLIVQIYGGGFISGDNDSLTAMARAWVRLFGAVVVSISYRLAPEHKWPVPWNDAWDSTAWVAEHAAELRADPHKGFIIGGVSAGASLSAFITNESQTNKLAHPITGQWLCVPSLMSRDAVPEKYKAYHLSLEHNEYAPIFPTSALDSLRRHVEWDDQSRTRWPALYPT